MVTLNVNKNSYQIPERFTVSQWQEMSKWSFDEPAYWPRIISAATGANKEELEGAKPEVIELCMAFIITNINRRKPFKVMDFNGITFGQFVDMDCWLQMGVEKYITDIVELLSDGTEWADEALWLVDKYAEFRQHTLRQYSELFGLNDYVEEDDEEEETQFDPLRVARAWYEVIVNLADEDVLKIDQITDEPLKKILNFMAWKKEKQIAENLRALAERTKQILK